MIPDYLISKYLDGDLTQEEDRELRSELSTDKDAREAFDASVLIHIAMCCDDESEPPADLVDSTLREVLQLASNAQINGRKRSSLSPMMTVLAVLLLCVPISDQLPWIVQPEVQQTSSAKLSALDVSGAPSVKRIKSGNSTGSFAPPMQLAVEVPVAVEESHEPPARVPIASTESMALEGIGRESEDVFIARPIIESQHPTAMILSSYVGTGIGGGGGRSNATVVSQSFGYAIDDRTQVGLEVGAVSYTIAQYSTMAIRDGEGSINNKGSRLMMLNPSQEGGSFSRVVNSTSSEAVRYWGTAFIQRTVLQTSVADVSLRGGAGMDQMGIVAYARLQSHFSVNSWVSITLGSEARIMSLERGITTGTIGRSEYGPMFTVMAGIQFNP